MIPTEQKQPDQYKIADPTGMDGWCDNINVFGEASCALPLYEATMFSFDDTSLVDTTAYQPESRVWISGANISLFSLMDNGSPIVTIQNNGKVTLGEGISPETAANIFWSRVVEAGIDLQAKLERLAYLEGELLAKETSIAPDPAEIDDMFAAYERAKKAVQ